jgi:hypothetical protein
MKKIIYSMLFIAGWFGLMSSGCGDGGGGGVTTFSPSGGGTGINGSTARFAIKDNKLYAIHNDSLKVVNIENANDLTIEHGMLVGSGIEAMYPFGNSLYIASNTGVHAYSLSNPRMPVYQNFIGHVTGCDPVVANNTNLFLTIHSGTSCRGNDINELQIFELGPNNSATILARKGMNNPLGLGFKNNTLYVCDRGKGLVVFDITNPGVTSEIKTILNSDFKDVIPYENLLVCIVESGVRYYDITDNTNPIFLSEVKK